MQTLSRKGIDLIKRYEGFSAKAYFCPAGVLTIGHGHVLSDTPANRRRTVTSAEAEEYLISDVRIAERAVHRLITAPLTQGQFDAVVSFTFNLGSGALQRSGLRRKLNREEYDDATLEFRKWVYAGGRRLPGLIKRRAAEAERFLT